MRTGGQEHFYLETNACIAIPKREKGEMELIATTQSTAETQHWAAKALGVDANKIVARVKRIGKQNDKMILALLLCLSSCIMRVNISFMCIIHLHRRRIWWKRNKIFSSYNSHFSSS